MDWAHRESFEEEIRAMQLAALEAGQSVRAFREGDSLQVEAKKHATDIVTFVDSWVQRFLRDDFRAKFPNIDFMGEESLDDDPPAPENPAFRWVVDPIDGTMPFAHRIDTYGISIALQRVDPEVDIPEIVAGLIYFPSIGRMMWASKGEPSQMLNVNALHDVPEEALEVALEAALPQAIALDAGTQEIGPGSKVILPHGIFHHADDLPRLKKAWEQGVSPDSFNSAYAMANVAMGGMPGLYQRVGGLWDPAAGAIIVENAGGAVEMYYDADRQLHVIAANTQANLEKMKADFVNIELAGKAHGREAVNAMGA